MKTKYTGIKLWKEHELIVTLVYWVNDFNFSEFLGPVCLNSAGCGNFSLHISYILQVIWITLREKCLYLEFFWSVFPNIRTECGKILCISPYSVRMQENTDQKNSEYEHFLRSVFLTKFSHYDQRFSRNILVPLCLKNETPAHVQLAISFTNFLIRHQ